MEIDRKILIRGVSLVAGVIGLGTAIFTPDQLAPTVSAKEPGITPVTVATPIRVPTQVPEPYHNVMIPNSRHELAFTRSLRQGDMLFLRTQRIWLMHDWFNQYEQSNNGGIILAAVRARTDIRELNYTTYPGLPVDELLVTAKSHSEAEQQQEFVGLITEQLRLLRQPGVLERDCIQGCSTVRFVAFNARDVPQSNGTTNLELKRIRNQRNWY